MSQQVNKTHRKPKEKKERPADSKNPKAYAFANPGRLQRQAARSHDVKEKRLHVPLVDRLPEEAPPLIVAVVGPPQVGKTTLIKSLIRRYTKQTLSSPTGPLTVVTSKRRRLTFIECPADSLASMIDIAKVVDIVLLMIDGKYGFEMETMEFLNVLSASGMPGNVFGILTKLDLFKKQDTLRAQKKRLKHRFWSELYQGAKLFYLSGVVNGRYPDREVLNLSRFLSVMKNPRPLVWRNSHPYCLADRYLDITPPTELEKNPRADRTIALYGYLRGTNFPAQGARVHIPGLGDLNVAEIEALPDPCPTPHMDQAMNNANGKVSRRRLGEKQKVLFAPMSDVGGVLVDRDAVYIDVKTSTFDATASDVADRGLGEQLVIGLQGDRRLLGESKNGLRLFENGTNINRVDDDRDDLTRDRRPVDFMEKEDDGFAESLSDQDSAYESGNSEEEDGIMTEEVPSDEEMTDDDAELSAGLEHESEASTSDVDEIDRAREDDMHVPRQIVLERPSRRVADLSRMLYDMTLDSSEVVRIWNGHKGNDLQKEGLVGTDEENTDNFFRTKSFTEDEADEDRMVPRYDYQSLAEKWAEPVMKAKLKTRFAAVRTSRTQRDGAMGDEHDSADDGDEDHFPLDSEEDIGDGAFEDLEGDEGVGDPPAVNNNEIDLAMERERNARKKEELKLRFEEEDRDGLANDRTNARRDGIEDQEFGEDDWYDAQKAKIQKQLDINRAEYAEMDERTRARVEGFRAGTYARIVLENVPYEFSAHFNARVPLIIGGLNSTEDRFGLVQVRIKRHRWHPKILKTNDPLIFSLGWRRFQTLPLYSISDSRTRNRMLKYTPEHMHCFGTFYGPLIAPNTGFSCIQTLSNKSGGFRIAATGVVLSVDKSTEIVKKLKLKGVPHKVYKNTAIIKDMFSSELEIAKFKAGNLRTVSGIRGMIKGRAGNQYPEGYIRAGFEDKILMSDLVFLSSWTLVQPREFYMPVTNLLMPAGRASEDEEEAAQAVWSGMRLTGQVRRDEGLKTPQMRDSSYRKIERPTRHFNPLRVPRKLAGDLPYKSQIARMKPQQRETYMQKRAVLLGGEEKKARDLMQKLTTVRNEKVAKRAVAQEKRKEPYRKKVVENLEKKAAREKREKGDYWRREGKKRGVEDAGPGGSGGGGGGGKRRR